MSNSTTNQNLLDRYQDYRTRRFIEHRRKTAHSMPGWHTQRRRRALVIVLAATFALMFGVGVAYAFGVKWSALLWLPACGLFFPTWFALQIVSGRQGDAPEGALDEYEVAQRNSARSIGLTVTQSLMMLPIAYLIIGSVVTGGTDENMAYAGGLLALTVLLVGGSTPAMILGWTRREPDFE